MTVRSSPIKTKEDDLDGKKICYQVSEEINIAEAQMRGNIYKNKPNLHDIKERGGKKPICKILLLYPILIKWVIGFYDDCFLV